ncbi:MAG: 3-deoxy-D-manno-octulosonic acid transferase [Verrucomicrobia bacterium]|nr:3-deoxy-D-manno-octulosonic acid transferase [Verrucomicrobiota bacterium]
MTWLLYEIAFWIALLLASPYYLLRMKRRGGYARNFSERFGVFARDKKNRLRGLQPVWIHAVSVGEVDIALQIIARLKEMPHCPPLALSTTTSTGHALASGKLPDDIPLFYSALDSRLCFGRIHRLLSPRAFILIEAELWPNHLRFCAKRGIPVVLINARLSDRCYPRYLRFRWLFAGAFQAFRLVTLQSAADVQRLSDLGFPRESLKVMGSLKYDTARGADDRQRERLLADLASLSNRPLWVAGSTHPGEEAILLDIFKRLRVSRPGLVLALAPRHAERTEEIAGLTRSGGFRFARRSALNKDEADDLEVLILDTTGELKYLYERATVIFIGKSLTGHGGQNIIEPAACGKPVLFGPNMENFLPVVDDFLSANAAIQAKNASDLESRVALLLDHEGDRTLLGKRAAEVVSQKQGSLQRSTDAIRDILIKAGLFPSINP